jgi:phosphinothricin acetyltransferase
VRFRRHAWQVNFYFDGRHREARSLLTRQRWRTNLIREARSADAQPICDIYNDYVENSFSTFDEIKISVEVFQRQMESGVLPWLIFIDDSDDTNVLGYAYAKPWKERAAYRHTVETSVYVASDAIKNRIGTRLYEKLLNELGNREIHTAIAGIALPNPASVALHERFGFEKVAHFKRTGRKFDRWIDVGYWQKTINDRIGFSVKPQH